MCKALCVSRSGYYRFLNRAPSSKEERRRNLESNIVEYFERFKARYGAPRLAIALKQNAIKCSLNTVAKVLSERGLRAKNGRNYRYSCFSYATLNVAENVLNRQFSAASPNEKWVTDITYIRCKGQWLYLATVMDLFSRAIVGWSLDTQMTESLIMNALKIAIERREVRAGLIIHSDRGVQYRALKYQGLISKIGAKASMSRRSNCWDIGASMR